VAAADAALDLEEGEVRAVLGDLVFSGEDLPMEAEVGRLLVAQGKTLAVAESLTGGLVASRIVAVPGSSEWFTGGVVAYDSRVKFDVLGVPEGPVIGEAAVLAMAHGVRRLLHADVGIATTGVAGPTEQEGHPPGTVWIGLTTNDRDDAVRLRLPGDRDRVRQFSAISLMDRLRRSLLT
jgi:nicotinamide-nucleotide amidase